MTEAPAPERGIDVALAVPLRGERILVARRGSDAQLAGLWEFPGGKVDPGESPPEAARRELREETRLDGGAIEPLGLFVHEYPDRRVRLHAFIVREPEGTVETDGGREHAWHSLPELEELEMPEANAAILRALRWRVS